MQWRNSPDRYGAVMMALHWLTVLLIVFAVVIVQFKEQVPRASIGDLMWAHKTAGLWVLVLLAVRLGWRFFDPPPTAEKTGLGPLADRAGQLAHVLLYLLLIAVPVIGILMTFAAGRGINLFGLMQIASPWTKDPALAGRLSGPHEFLTYALILLALAHSVAAIVHHRVLRDRTLVRMLPGGAGTK